MNRGQDQLIIIDENLSNSHFSKYCLNMKFFFNINCMSNKFQYCSFFRNRFENSSVQSIQCSGTCHSCNVLLYMKLHFSRPSIHLTRLCSVKRKNDVQKDCLMLLHLALPNNDFLLHSQKTSLHKSCITLLKLNTRKMHCPPCFSFITANAAISL